MVAAAATPFEKQMWQSKATETSHPNQEKKRWVDLPIEGSEIEISKELFDLIPCNSRLRYCVDVGTRNGGKHPAAGDTLISHSLLVTKDSVDDDQRQGPESFVDNDHENGQNTWFGILLQPDYRAFQSLKRLHEPLGNLCLQISPSVEGGSTNERSLGCILKQNVADLPLDFDFLGLYEVGYSNYWLLRTFLNDSVYRPKVVCISYDNKRPTDIAFVPNRKNEHELPSLKATVDLMTCYDYALVRTTSRCCFFSTNELYEEFLGTGIRHPVREILAVSDRLNARSSSSTFLTNQQSFEKMRNEMRELKDPSDGTDNGSGTLGTKWLLQRRKVFEATKMNGPTKEIKIERIPGNDNISARKSAKSAAVGEFETRDDFLVSAPTKTTPVVREGIQTENLDEKRETESRDIMDTIRVPATTVPKYVPPNMKMIHPPDPVGETLSQKMKEYQEPTKNPQPETVQDSLLELKNEILKLSHENKSDEMKTISEGFMPNANEIDDDFMLESFPLDLTAICDPVERNNRRERLQCAKTLLAELQRNGNAKVCGTSISRFICRDALYASHLLLCEADEKARGSCRSVNGVLRGYTPKCTERSSSSGLTDMVRKFRLGSKKASSRNLWPVGGILDDETDEYIQASLQEYHDSLHRVAVSITKCLQEILDRDDTNSHSKNTAISPHFENDPDTSLLTAIHCERGSRHDTRKPLIADHNDTGLVTLLLLDSGDCATVQHELKEGSWESVNLPNVVPLDPVFMVYAGESLKKLSGDRIPTMARRVFPSSGNQTVNGLIFSLMPSEGHVHPSTFEEPLDIDLELSKNPISKLASELNDIDEMFRSVVFAEEEDFQYESDVENYFDEDFHLSLDPFEQHLEEARDLRRSHIESQQLGPRRPSRASYPFRGAEAGLSRFRNQSSRRATFGGREVMDDEESMYSIQERPGPIRNDHPTQLLGSPILPIVIETTKGNDAKEIIKIDEDFDPIPLPTPDYRVQRSKLPPQRSDNNVNSKCFLPLANPSWKPLSKEMNYSRNIATQKEVSFNAPPKARKSMEESGKKKHRFLSGGIMYNKNHYEGRKYARQRNQIKASPKSNAPTKFSIDEDKRKEDPRVDSLLAILEEISIQSSDASAVLDELLGDNTPKAEQQIQKVEEQIRRAPSQNNSKSKNSNEVIKAPSSTCEDLIYKACRESISTEQSILKTCAEVQQSLPLPPSNVSVGALTEINTLYNQLSSKRDEYVPFRGSVVEWKMRENAKKIKKSSLKWEQRGYRFGRENAKKIEREIMEKVQGMP